MKQLSLTEARAKLSTLVAEVDKGKGPMRSRNGRKSRRSSSIPSGMAGWKKNSPTIEAARDNRR